MPASEFYEWLIFDAIEPIGAHRSDIQSGTIAAAVYNVNRTKQEQPVLAWSDVLPRWSGPEDKVNAELQAEALRSQMLNLQVIQQMQAEERQRVLGSDT